MIFTSLSPNTERDDVWRALKMLFKPWEWVKGKEVEMLEKDFKAYLKVDYAYAFQSGRNALYAILQSLNLKPEDEVLLQGYTCVAVPEPILWTGAKLVYVDVLQDFTMDPVDLRKKITKQSKVVILQHTFGHVARIDELMTVAKHYNLFVVEDCAHALGAKYKDMYAGTFGDASFFSFGRDKVISSVFGGMTVVKDQAQAQKIKKIQIDFKTPSPWYVFQQLMHPLVLAVAKMTYDWGKIGKAILEASKRLHLISLAVERTEREGGKPSFFKLKMPNALATLARAQLKKLDRYNNHRREIADRYDKELLSTPITLPLFEKFTYPIVLRYTILVSDPAALIAKARVRGIELGDWYQQSIAPKNVNYEKIGYNPVTCPNAEKLAAHSVNLPTHIGITDKDARYIAQFVHAHAH